MRIHYIISSICAMVCLLVPLHIASANDARTDKEIAEERMGYYLQFATELVPWYHLAAIDQYERNIQQVRNDLTKAEGPISIQFTPEHWFGLLNPDHTDTSPNTIAIFGGYGMDGNDDGLADLSDPMDVLMSMSSHLAMYGPDENDYKAALWHYYKREATVNQIVTIAKLYKHFETVELDKHMFPIPKGHHYSYRGTWGTNRGWGGRRSP